MSAEMEQSSNPPPPPPPPSSMNGNEQGSQGEKPKIANGVEQQEVDRESDHDLKATSESKSGILVKYARLAYRHPRKVSQNK